MSARQETVYKADAVSNPTATPAVAVPKTGEKFKDEELHARFGVPMRGGIRVNEERRCIVLVDLVDADAKYANTDEGDAVSYMGQDSDRDGMQNQDMSANNLALRHSRENGYTVLYFIKQEGNLVFNSCVEYDSHRFEVEEKDGKRARVIIKFRLKRVAGMPAAATGGKTESLGCPWVAELEEDKLPTETVGEYLVRMANIMEPGLCTQKDAEEMDEGLRQLARGEYVTLDDLRSESDVKCT